MTKQNRQGVIWIVGGVLGLVGIAFLVFMLPVLLRQRVNIFLGDGAFTAEVALTESARHRGLSGVEKLYSDQALLMVFPTDDKWGIWMKDMNFPIDIVWLNSDKEVIYTVENATPDSYPTLFLPNDPTRYVIELAAGTVKAKTITLNKKATFQINREGIK